MTAENLEEQAIQELVQKVMKANRYRNGAWTKVIEAGRDYAMMKASGKYVNAMGVIMTVGDPEGHLAMFHAKLLQAVEDAYLEDALVGIALSGGPIPG